MRFLLPKKGVYFTQYRETRNYENMNEALFASEGVFDIPTLEPVHCDVKDWLSFNYAKTTDDPKGYGIHFFIDDYQFIRLWRNPKAYVNMLSKFDAVMSPDFSTYLDFPRVIQIYNHYRKHWLGAYWQAHGMTVVPTISWADDESLNWCFDGEPRGGTVAVSSVGTQMDRGAQIGFMRGYNAMMERLQPESVIFYGEIPEECKADNVFRIPAYQERLRKFNVPKKDNEQRG